MGVCRSRNCNGCYIHVLGTAMGVYIKFFSRCGQSGSAGAKHFQNLDFFITAMGVCRSRNCNECYIHVLGTAMGVCRSRNYTHIYTNIHIYIYTHQANQMPHPPHPTPCPQHGVGGGGGVGGWGIWFAWCVYMYICIYVYLCICVFRDSHFQRLSKNIFNFGFLGFPLSAPFQKHV